MKMTMLSITSTWLCVTGVAVVSSYCILANCQSKTGGQKAAQVASGIAKRGTIPQYKSTNRHSSALKKTTTAKVVKEVKLPTYVPNPIYPQFVEALNGLTQDAAEIAKYADVLPKKAFSLMKKDGKPVFIFPEEYTRVGIGGLAIGDELKDGNFDVQRKKIENTDQYKVDEVVFRRYKRLEEPELYCTDVTYSAIPATRQIDSIKMHGNLIVGNVVNAHKMVNEISGWMKEDYKAVDRYVSVPPGTLALKKFRIGKEMEVNLTVKWKQQKTDDGCDADINIDFTVGELVKENQTERKELGEAADKARASELRKSGVNYFTVRPKVKTDAVMRKVVY